MRNDDDEEEEEEKEEGEEAVMRRGDVRWQKQKVCVVVVVGVGLQWWTRVLFWGMDGWMVGCAVLKRQALKVGGTVSGCKASGQVGKRSGAGRQGSRKGGDDSQPAGSNASACGCWSRCAESDSRRGYSYIPALIYIFGMLVVSKRRVARCWAVGESIFDCRIVRLRLRAQEAEVSMMPCQARKNPCSLFQLELSRRGGDSPGHGKHRSGKV